MYQFRVHETINELILLLYRIRLWHSENDKTIRTNLIQISFIIYYSLLPISLIVGAYETNNTNESIFLILSAVITTVMAVKFCYIIWRKEEILQLLHQLSVYTTDDRGEFDSINEKMNRFMKIAKYYFYAMLFGAVSSQLFVPFLGNEKKLFVNIGFPLDYKTNDIAFWIAFLFSSSEGILCGISCLFPIIVWYLLINCGLMYKVLGNKLKNIGANRMMDLEGNKVKRSKKEKEMMFRRDLRSAIQSHQDTCEFVLK